jgi:flagellar FliL protein
MKIVIIGVAALVVLLGGGFAALKALKIGPFAPPEAEVASEAPPKLEPPRFVAVDPLVIPVFSGNQVAAQIQVTVKLETVGSDNEQKLMRLLPQLTNHLYQDLYAFVPRLLREEDRLNVTVLRRRMQMVADKVAGPGIVDNVLIQSVTDTRHKDESKS